MINLRSIVYLIIFIMPLYLWRFSIVGIPMNILEMMIYILFFVWTLNKIKNVISSKNGKSNIVSVFKKYIFLKQFYLLHIGIVLLLLGAIVSTAFSSDIRTSLGIFKGWFVSPFLFFIVFINIIKKREHIYWSLKSWIVSGICVSLISFYYLLSGNITFDGRLKAFYLSPNHLAMYLAPIIIILIYFLLNEKKENKLFNLILLIIVSIPLYFTYSYGAFLGILAGIFYLLFKSKKFTYKNIFISIISVFLFFLLIFMSANKVEQIANSQSRSSFHSRMMIWNSAGKIIKDNPLFGIGPGTFQETYLSYSIKFDESYLEWAVPQPHNIFLAFYLQTGFIGLIGFILILIWLFSYKNMVQFVFFIKALMIYTLVHGLVDTTYWKNDLALIFWIIIGLNFVNSRNILKNNDKTVYSFPLDNIE
ncbi:MAG: O-antigen ligase family protein [Patescibacteria group bacterium]|nr:O-antigen ligase family protein [Patescibacteria group bacterium]